MKTQSIPFFLFALLLCGAAWGQQRTLKLNLDYSVGIPTGNLKTLTPEVSGRGWGMGLMYGISDRFSVGIGGGFQDFYQKYPRQVMHQSGSDISAVVSYSLQTIPVLVKGKYAFQGNGMLRPYVGVGVGANYIRHRKFYGQFAESYTKIGFAAQPELGLQVPVGRAKTSDVHIAAGYNIMPYEQSEVKGLHHAFVKAGFSFALR